MKPAPRTDLAAEARDLLRSNVGKNGLPAGVAARTEQRRGLMLDIVDILDAHGSKSLCKPVGRYTTLSLDVLFRRETDGFERAAEVLAAVIADSMHPEDRGPVLVVGLGNEAITPDALGPLALRSVMVTRHLKRQLPAEFAPFREVSALRSGVLGTTGIESAELVAAAVRLAQPAQVIAVDALCARDTERLCRTVQVTDAGIVPGSGVGNARAELCTRTLGVPVTAIGVPTVVDASTLCMDLCGSAPEHGRAGELIVTPRDIDSRIRDAARLIGYAINLALHRNLSIGDVDMFLS